MTTAHSEISTNLLINQCVSGHRVLKLLKNSSHISQLDLVAPLILRNTQMTTHYTHQLIFDRLGQAERLYYMSTDQQFSSDSLIIISDYTIYYTIM